MTPERQRAILRDFQSQLGAGQAWRLVILCGLGALLCLAVVVILAGVYFSGEASLDDIGVPAVLVGLLAPIMLLGGGIGVRDLLALSRHELLVALRAPQPAGVRAETVHDPYGPALRFHVEGGGSYQLWVDPRTGDEILAWLECRG